MMHQPIDGDPKSTYTTPLHRESRRPNVDLRNLWLSQRADPHGCHQLSATFSYTRGYTPCMTSLKFPGCFTN